MLLQDLRAWNKTPLWPGCYIPQANVFCRATMQPN